MKSAKHKRKPQLKLSRALLIRGGGLLVLLMAVLAAGLWGAGRYNDWQFDQAYTHLSLPYTLASRTQDQPVLGPLNPAGAQYATYRYAATGTRQAVADTVTARLRAAGYKVTYQSVRVIFAYNNHDRINVVASILPDLPAREDPDAGLKEPAFTASSVRIDAGWGITYESAQ